MLWMEKNGGVFKRKGREKKGGDIAVDLGRLQEEEKGICKGGDKIGHLNKRECRGGEGPGRNLREVQKAKGGGARGEMIPNTDARSGFIEKKTVGEKGGGGILNPSHKGEPLKKTKGKNKYPSGKGPHPNAKNVKKGHEEVGGRGGGGFNLKKL